MADLGPSRPERLRQRAAAERQKVQELDRLLTRLEARLSEDASASASRRVRAPSGAERRVFERQEADLLIRYRPPGRPTPLVGRVRDLSRGGLRFSASRELRVGEILQASVHRRGASGLDFGGEMYLEVVHCRQAEQVWQVGARFAPLPTRKFESAERRRSKRHLVRLELAFRLPGEDAASRRGEVRDISAGGLRFYSWQRLRPDSLAAVAIASNPTAAARGGTRITVNAMVRVVRCRRVGTRYEVGAQFVS